MKQRLTLIAAAALLCLGVTSAYAQQAALDETHLRAMNAGVQRADARVDLAERSLALARRQVETKPRPGRLTRVGMTAAESDRIAFYKKDGIVARQALLQELQGMRSSAVAAPATNYVVVVYRP